MSESEIPPVDWQSLLFKAAKDGDIKTVQEALDHGAGINDAGESQLEEALRCAVWRGHLDIVRFLLEKGAQVNKKQDRGETAIFVSCHTGNLELTQLLIDAGAEVNIANRSGITPLMNAAGPGGNLKLVQLLVEHGADIQAKGEWDYDAVYFSVKEDHPEIVEFLVEKGRLNTGYVLERAVGFGHANIARMMLKLGANKHLESCKKALKRLEGRKNKTSLELRDSLEAIVPEEREKRLQAEQEEHEKQKKALKEAQEKTERKLRRRLSG